jgi:hypothetical protein
MTHGISPKVLASSLTLLVVALLNRFAIDLSREVEVALEVLFTALAGYFAPPGDVVIDEGPVNDDLLVLPDDQAPG